MVQEMKRSSDHIDGDAISSGLEWKCGLNVKTTVALLLSLLFLAFLVLRDPPSSDSVWSRVKPPKVMEDDDHILRPNDAPGDNLLAGLLPPGFDRKSCLSRHQSVLLYHKKLKRQPSSYLISRLRSYEALHRRCGPHTDSYKNNVGRLINSAGNNNHSDGCNYLVWIAFSGLGNRILTLASAFLYAVLTNRVLLVDPGNHIPNLFCEPFPNTSWYLPKDFPIANQFKSFDQNSTFCHGYMLKHNVSAIIPPFIYVHLIYDIDQHHKLFYSDKEQIFLQKVPWVVMRTDEYFVPSLFLIQSFKKDLENMFPDKDSVFHLLGRYLIHPTNPVWGLITRYYQAYLAMADEKIGIQIRVFERETGPFQHILDQIISCTMKQQHILPQVYQEDSPIAENIKKKKKKKAVLVTSLSPWYSEQIQNMYSEHPTLTGEVVGIFQPSHEEYQRTENLRHNMKALSEIYLLSMTDVLVTSGWSTFGYVAQSLGGLRPWILYKPENRTAPDPPCRRAMSMEPCFHDPPSYDGADPHVKPCEDRSWGLKLIAA